MRARRLRGGFIPDCQPSSSALACPWFPGAGLGVGRPTFVTASRWGSTEKLRLNTLLLGFYVLRNTGTLSDCWQTLVKCNANRCNVVDVFFGGNLLWQGFQKRGHVHRSPDRSDVLLHGSRGCGVVRDSCAPKCTNGLFLEVRPGQLSFPIMPEWCLAASGRSRSRAV